MICCNRNSKKNNDNLRSKIIKKNMSLYASGQLISLFGSSIYTFFISLYILETTGSAISFGITFALGTLPRLILGPISGVIADKGNRKKLIIICDFISGFIMLLLLLVNLLGEFRLSYIYISTFLLAAFNTIFNTALISSIPNIVDESNIVKINSISQTILSLSSILGPFIGGLVFSLTNINFFLLINGLSFIASSILEIFIDFNICTDVNITEKDNEKSSIIKDFYDGLKYLYSQKWLFNLLIFILLFNSLIVIGLNISVPFITKQILKFSSFQMGVINIMFPLGILVASIIFSTIKQIQITNKQIISSIVTMGLSICFIGIITSGLFMEFTNSQYLIVISILYFIIGITETIINIPVMVKIQKLVPNDMLGRVQGMVSTLVLGLVPLSSILGGILLEKTYPWMITMISGIIITFLTGLMLRINKIKK